MHANVVLLVQLALLAVTADNHQIEEDNEVYEEDIVVVRKCCNEYEMLSADGESCVDAPWPHNASLVRGIFDAIISPHDEEWLQRWLPPGLQTHSNIYVVTYVLSEMTAHSTTSVSASSVWNSSLLENEELFRNTVAFLKNGNIARPRPPRRFREAKYCVDASPPPLGPFAMRFFTLCTEEECAIECCRKGELLKKNETEHWLCEKDAEGNWTPSKSALALDTEFPTLTLFRERPKLSIWEIRNPHRTLENWGIIENHFSTWETCFAFYRSSDGSLHDGLFYIDNPRVARGVYWLLRPLCFLSALLLLASLVSVACDKSMRRKIHGRCLGTHAACLLAFNIGQIWYYIAISDRVDKQRDEYAHGDLKGVCKHVGLAMYFLLTSAWFWLTALCLNMTKGFSLQVTLRKKESRKRFLALFAFAWGLPILMTITCSILLAHDIKSASDVRWYNPPLAESRVCYDEFITTYNRDGSKFFKSGTALFYFGPVACLVICNIICLAMTLRKVQYLKRGNSVLRREEDLIPLGQRHPKGNNPSSSHTATGHGSRNRTSVDAKTIKLYVKMILMTGVIELLTEIIMWSTSVYPFTTRYTIMDLGLAYRAVGYVTDLFRAAVVTWLAAPDGGYLGLVRRLRPGKEEQKSALAGGAGRRKQNAA